MKNIASSSRKIIFIRQFSQKTHAYKPVSFLVQQFNETVSSHLKAPLSRISSQINSDFALDEKTKLSLLRSIQQSETVGVPEELEQQLDRVTGSRIHETSRYDSSRPNERSSNVSAFYEPSLYNIEEMDSASSIKEKSENSGHGLSNKTNHTNKTG